MIRRQNGIRDLLNGGKMDFFMVLSDGLSAREKVAHKCDFTNLNTGSVCYSDTLGTREKCHSIQLSL